MVSNLKQSFPNVDWEQALASQSLSTNARAEELSEAQWILLSQAL